jgi:hypothetical protein
VELERNRSSSIAVTAWTVGADGSLASATRTEKTIKKAVDFKVAFIRTSSGTCLIILTGRGKVKTF